MTKKINQKAKPDLSSDFNTNLIANTAVKLGFATDSVLSYGSNKKDKESLKNQYGLLVTILAKHAKIKPIDRK